MGMELFEHNMTAYKSALNLMRQTGKAAVIHPTGTGKSFIGFKFAQEHPDYNIIWLTPSEYIVKTQLENLQNEGGGEIDNITFITYAKLMLMSDEEIEELNPDATIYDEFHRGGASQWESGIRRLINAYPKVWMLGLSATNIRYLDNQRNMADELFDGNIASEMTLGEALVRGILPEPKYVISVYGYQQELKSYEKRVDSIVNDGIRDKNRKELDRLRRALDMADGLDKVFAKHMPDKTGKYIVFCSNNEHLDEMISQSKEWFKNIDCDAHIYKVYSQDIEASSDFADFKEDTSPHLKLLFCINMLNEGVHVNDIDGVILFRPTVSPIIYKQQIGRALSANKSKRPVIFDVVNNFENLYSISTIEEEVQLAVSYYKEHGNADKILCDSFEITDETCDCRNLFENLEKSLSSTWEIYFRAAKIYYENNGDLDLPKSYISQEGLTLGMWLKTQRSLYRNGELSESRILRLEEIGINWNNPVEEHWKKAFNHAKEYYETYGNLDVKSDYITKDGFELGLWIARNRAWYKNRSHSKLLNESRIKSLESIGMIWGKNNALWERNFSEAEKYFINNGNLNVPADYVTESKVRLGAWINKLKQLANGNARAGTALSEEQIERLSAIGMEWDNKYEAQWKKCYRAACEYYRTYGNLNVPAMYKTDNGILLGKWIRRQRENKKLSEEKRKQLDRINMIWNTGDSWEQRYTLLKAYYSEHGNIEIPQSYRTENKIWLGKWLAEQRNLYKQGKLEAVKIKKLEAMGMNWLTEPERKWETAFSEALKYYTVHGNLEMTNVYKSENGFALGRWLVLQRQNYKSNATGAVLDDERIERLNSIGMVWDKRSVV